MSFNDVIKNSVLEGFASTDITPAALAVVLGITTLLGVYLYVVYRLASRNAFYSRDFNKALALMPVITAAIVLAMQSSIVISLGMVGALSIVRFRNAVKDPMDLVFLFWSISIGIVCGARLYSIAIIASLVVTVLVFLLDLVPAGKAPFLLVVNGSDPNLEHALDPVVRKYAKSCRVKSRNLTAQGVDLIVELRTGKEAQLVHACSAVPGVESVSLLSHDGEARF